MLYLVALLLVLGATVIPGCNFSRIPRSINVTGQIKDGVPFRVLCHLNATTQPDFSIGISGWSSNNTVLFNTGVSLIGNVYRMALFSYVPTTYESMDYNQTFADDPSGIPAIPFVMGFRHGTFFVASYKKGLNGTTPYTAESLARIQVVALGSNVVDCSLAECFRGNI